MSRYSAARCAAASPLVAGAVGLLALFPATLAAQNRPIDVQLQQLDRLARTLEERLSFILDQYGQEQVTAGIDQLERRFSEAEIHFLLEDYGASAVLLYDLADNPTFRRSPHYLDALYYLAESLYRQESYLPSRTFFLELVGRGGGRYLQDALVRLLDISGRVGDFSQVDEYVERLRGSGAPMRPQVLYVYGKFTYGRNDLKDGERIRRALDAFAEVPEDSAFGVQSLYYIGTLYVQADDYDSAVKAFSAAVGRPAERETSKRVQELAWLALGRVFYERGELDSAIDAYQRVDRNSAHYYQSLYEVAWTFVKKGDFDNALRACEILLVGATDSPLAPEAQILIGNLYAKAKKYEDALGTYGEVINTYAPVRDEIDALLALHDDPVRYFNELISEEGESFEVENILPPVAVKWASTEQDVKAAMSIVGDLQSGGKDVVEGRKIADRILDVLDAGTLEPFPTLAEGHRRATELLNATLQYQTDLADAEQRIVGDRLDRELRERLTVAAARREALQAGFAALPTTQEEMEERNRAWLKETSRVEQAGFRQKLAAESLIAQIVAIRKWVRDTREERTDAPEAEEEFMRRLDKEQQVATQLVTEAKALIDQVKRLEDAVRSGTADSAEKRLRVEYAQALENERALVAQARAALPSLTVNDLRQIDRLYQRGVELSQRTARFLERVQNRARRRRDELRKQVLVERQRLEGYGGEVSVVMVDTKDLVGQIALNSFRRVQDQFYELILKADVGIIDVAWGRKSDKSKEIQRLAKEKDHELRLLDREFEEVLREND